MDANEVRQAQQSLSFSLSALASARGKLKAIRDDMAVLQDTATRQARLVELEERRVEECRAYLAQAQQQAVVAARQAASTRTAQEQEQAVAARRAELTEKLRAAQAEAAAFEEALARAWVAREGQV
jgi:hypothetical protein